jgi:hypothetical protein
VRCWGIRRGERLYTTASVASNEATIRNPSFNVVRGIGIRGNVCFDRARDSRYWAAPHGWRKSDSLGMVADRRPARVVIGCLMAAIAYGFAARKAWSRHLVMAIFVLIIVYASALGALNVLRHTIMWRAIVNASLAGCVSAWYFYFKPNVAEYFLELRKR